jgi:hypothetical protein
VLLKDTYDSPESLSLLAQQLIRIALHEKERIRAAAFRAMTRFIFLSLSSSSGSNLETVLRRSLLSLSPSFPSSLLLSPFSVLLLVLVAVLEASSR